MWRVLLITILFFSPGVFAKLKYVLHISSYHPQYYWTLECNSGLQNILKLKAEIKTVYLDTKRILPDEYEANVKEALQEMHSSPPDLVVLSDDNALRLIGPYLEASTIPVVFMGINANPRDYFKSGKLPINMTGILERAPFMGSLRILKSIIPDAKKILILTENSQTAKAQIRTLIGSRDQFVVQGILAEVKILESWTAWQNTVRKSYQDYDVLLPSAYFNIKTDSGRYIPPKKVIEWISANSRIPVFVNNDLSVGENLAMGGFVLDGEAHGRMAGLQALSILEGVSPSALSPIVDEAGILYFNQKQLNRFNIVLPETTRQYANFR